MVILLEIAQNGHTKFFVCCVFTGAMVSTFIMNALDRHNALAKFGGNTPYSPIPEGAIARFLPFAPCFSAMRAAR
jgi:hypothetical protein